VRFAFLAVFFTADFAFLAFLAFFAINRSPGNRFAR
jgi:hypothetical protein